MKKNATLFFGMFVGGALLFFWASPTQATLISFKLFKETYPGKDKSYYQCSICHTGKLGKKGELNPYGKSLGLVLPAALTVEQLKAAEGLEPDEDGVSSGEEIKAGTLPGDPASTP